MFTGIIESMGIIESIREQGSGKEFWISSPISEQFKTDQSVCHNGVCLTVEEVTGNQHKVTAVAETIAKTNLEGWRKGSIINLERSLPLNGRLDGHFVQGHVDGTGTCIDQKAMNGSWEYIIGFDKAFDGLVIEKGSISLEGISLTVFNVTENVFSIAVIPYTYQHTNIQHIKKGDLVNLEFDVIGKYIQKNIHLQQSN